MRSKSTNVNFRGQTIYVGIDVHKKSWKVTIRNEQHELKTFSQDPDPEILARHLSRNYPGASFVSVYEAGFCGFGPCRRLIDLGIDSKVVHPMDIPRSNKDKILKTDKIDSRKLCRLLFRVDQQYIHIPDEVLEADRALVRQRYRISRDVARTKNRLKSLFMQMGIQIPEAMEGSAARLWTKKYVQWMESIEVGQWSTKLSINRYIELGKMQVSQLKASHRDLVALSRKPRYHEDCERLRLIPGVGLLTALVILVQVGDIGRFTTLDKLCFYIGLVPQVHSSGERHTIGRMIKRGRREIKTHLIECAWIAVRKDPSLSARYLELCKRMDKNKAIIRIARNLLSRIRYVLTNKEPYQIGLGI